MKAVALCLLSSGLLLLQACSSDDPQSREAAMEAQAQRFGIDADVRVDDRGDAESVEIRGLGGARVGQNLRLPDEFPEDVPVAEDWNILRVTSAPTGGYMVQAMTGDGMTETAEMLARTLTDSGWSEVARDAPTAQMQRISFEKDDRLTSVNLMNTGQQITVQLATMKKP